MRLTYLTDDVSKEQLLAYVSKCVQLNVEMYFADADRWLVVNTDDVNIYNCLNKIKYEQREPTQEDVDKLNQELYELLEGIADEGEDYTYLELSTPVYATAVYDVYRSEKLIRAEVEGVSIDGFSGIDFHYDNGDYLCSDHFNKEDQIKVYQQAIKDTKSYLEDNER